MSAVLTVAPVKPRLRSGGRFSDVARQWVERFDPMEPDSELRVRQPDRTGPTESAG